MTVKNMKKSKQCFWNTYQPNFPLCLPSDANKLVFDISGVANVVRIKGVNTFFFFFKEVASFHIYTK